MSLPLELTPLKTQTAASKGESRVFTPLSQNSKLTGPGALSVLIFVCSLFVFRRVLYDFGNLGIGFIGDSRLFIWSIDYVAHEVRHGRFPWMVSNIYPQIGSVHFFSDTTVPGVGFALLPITLTFSAVASYNTSFILAPIAVALVTRRLGEVLGLSRLGAFVAGFSMAGCPYMAAHALAHANLIHIWIVPLAALGIAHLTLGHRRAAVRCLALSCGGGLWFSSELVAIVVVTGALGFADLIAGHAIKKCLWARSIDLEVTETKPPFFISRTSVQTLAVAIVVSVAVGFPVLYGNFAAPNHFSGGRHQLPNLYVTDGLNIIVPTASQAMSTDAIPLGDPPRWNLGIPFTGGIAEQSGYLSVLGVLFIGLRLRSRVRKAEVSLTGPPVFRAALRPAGLVDRLTIGSLVLSVGPRVHLWGDSTNIPMPFLIIDKTPVLRSILSGRMSAVVALGFAVMIAIEFSRKELTQFSLRPSSYRPWIALGLCSIALQLPTATFPSHAAGPDWLMLRDYRAAQCLGSGVNRPPRVLIIPYYESNVGFSWLKATRNEIALVRARWFARDYSVLGREYKLDAYLNGYGAIDEVVQELAELKVDCIAVVPNRLTAEQALLLRPIIERLQIAG